MSLTYALSAAINGPTGPRATLSHGLYRTKPHRRQSGPRDFHSSQAAGGPARDAVGKRFGGVNIANGDEERAQAIALRRHAEG